MSKNELIGSGLLNMGNTCFFNATIQCLLHAVPFCAEIKTKGHSSHCHHQEWCVYCEMESVYAQTKSSRTYEPRKLVLNLKKLFKKFRLGRQEDSHQFLRYFIEGLQKSDLNSKEKNQEKLRVLTENSKIFSIFGGIMKSSVECETCNHKSQIQEHVYDLSLECQRSNSLQESLNNYFRVDHLTGNNKYRCDHCKKLSNASKRFIFHRLPSVLTIQLKRFTNNLHKLGKFVQFPQALQLKKYSDIPQPSNYSLSGVVVHSGSSSFSGHYYSYVKAGSNWYKMDDSHVSRAQMSTVLSQKAYLLFYERDYCPPTIEEKKETLREQVQMSKQETKKQPPKIEIAPKKGFFKQYEQTTQRGKSINQQTIRHGHKDKPVPRIVLPKSPDQPQMPQLCIQGYNTSKSYSKQITFDSQLKACDSQPSKDSTNQTNSQLQHPSLSRQSSNLSKTRKLVIYPANFKYGSRPKSVYRRRNLVHQQFLSQLMGQLGQMSQHKT